jgi:hypothetical protein
MKKLLFISFLILSSSFGVNADDVGVDAPRPLDKTAKTIVVTTGDIWDWESWEGDPLKNVEHGRSSN